MSGSAPAVDRLVSLGYVAGAHGVGGALRAKLHNAENSTLAPGMLLVLRGEAGSDERVLTRVAPKPGSDMVRIWLEGIDGRDAAEALRGRELLVDRSALPEPDDDEYYLDDLVGLPVVRARAGDGDGDGDGDGEAAGFEELGTITGISSNGLQDLFVVELRGREWLLPALPVFIVALEADRVIADVHDDMLPEASGAS